MPVGRIRDPELLRRLHYEWDSCVICEVAGVRLSLHHVLKNPRQDVREGLVMLCGDGVQGCHGLVESHDPDALQALAEHIIIEREDVIEHLIERLGEVPAWYWLECRLRRLTKSG